MFRVTPKHINLAKWLIHIINLSFIGTWYFWAFSDNLGADPVKAIIHFTGMGAFNLLLLSLLISPLAKYTRQSQLIKLRRLLGLYAFTWAALHFANYILFDLQMAFQLLLEDIIKRPYITVGFTAFVVLLVMAVTSNRFSQRKLGKRWQKIHQLVYPASILIALHFIWAVKALDIEPMLYWVALLVLLVLRFKTVERRLFKFAGSGA